MRFARRALIGLIRAYQRFLSAGRPPRCRYLPTCSQYAIEAVDRFGPVRGVALAARRVLRCNPWSKGGVDMVPEHFARRHDHGAHA